MNVFLKISIPVFILGFITGNGFWYLASPLWIDRVVSEPLSIQSVSSELAAGEFRDANQSHKGSGTAKIYQNGTDSMLLRLTEFSVTNGPDLEVWLSAHPDPQNSGDVKGTKSLSLGILKGNIGNQTYVIPTGTDISDFGSVVIWCKQFGVLFSPATLNHGG